MIKAIETVYNGRRYRSRAEARWSIFFETLGIDSQYEVEGYEFDGIRYLPDFWLPSYNCWVEIKGPEPTEDELQKAHLLSLSTEKPVYIFFGDIWLPSQQKYGGAYLCRNTRWTQGYYWYECSDCKSIGLATMDDEGRFSCQCTTASINRKSYNNNSPQLYTAYKTARQARFEFGEQEKTYSKLAAQKQPSRPITDIPLLPAYAKTYKRSTRSERDHAYFWCEYCREWHSSELEKAGQVVADGCFRESPYRASGYRFYIAGMFTPEIEKTHGNVPDDVCALTEQQLSCWAALCTTPRIPWETGRRITAARLYRLLELNNRTENIKGTHLPERQTYLSWMLLQTPQVKKLQWRHWQFCLIEKYVPHLFRQSTVQFPEEIDPIPYWIEAHIKEMENSPNLLFTYAAYCTWTDKRGYICFSRTFWKCAMESLGYTSFQDSQMIYTKNQQQDIS